MAQGYSIFSQGQGPVVPISLFAESATAGINAGNALPTPLTAGITGAIKGYQTGLNIQATQQENTIRQNQIDQLPVANILQQAQADTAQATAKITQNKAVVDAATQATEIDATNTIYQDKAAQAKQELDVINLKNQFQKEMASADPATQAQLVLGGKYQGLFSADPKLQEAAYLGVENNPYNGLTEAQRLQLSKDRKTAGLIDINQKAAQQTYPQFVQSEQTLFANPVTSRLTAKSGQSPEVTYGNMELVDTGSVKTGSDGTTVLTDNQGKPVYNNDALARAGAKAPGYDVLYTDPNTGRKKLLASGLAENDDFIKDYSKYTGLKRIQTGANLRSNLQALDRSFQSTQPRGAQQTQRSSGIIGNFAKVNPTYAPTTFGTPVYVQQAQKILNLPDTATKEVALPLRTLSDTIARESVEPVFRGSASALRQKNDALDTIGKTMAYSQFQNSPEIQNQYTDFEVQRYNAALVQDAAKKINTFDTDPNQLEKLIAPFRANSPAQLYYKKNLSSINQQLKVLEDQYIANANQNQTAAVNGQTLPERFLSKIAGR